MRALLFASATLVAASLACFPAEGRTLQPPPGTINPPGTGGPNSQQPSIQLQWQYQQLQRQQQQQQQAQTNQTPPSNARPNPCPRDWIICQHPPGH